MTTRTIPSLTGNPVVIEEGEAETIPGCLAIEARLGARILELNNGIQEFRRHATTPRMRVRLDRLATEMQACVELRAVVKARRVHLHDASNLTISRVTFEAMRERFGPDVCNEIRARAEEMMADHRRRHALGLVGSVVPVGRVGSPRVRQ